MSCYLPAQSISPPIEHNIRTIVVEKQLQALTSQFSFHTYSKYSQRRRKHASRKRPNDAPYWGSIYSKKY